jgi:hypothetical protein
MNTLWLGFAAVVWGGCVSTITTAPGDEDSDGGTATVGTGVTGSATSGVGGQGAGDQGGSEHGGSGGGGSGEGGSGEGGSGEGGSGEGGARNAACVALEDIQIVDVMLSAGDDGIWTVGESAQVVATLLSPDDNFDYPSIRISPNSAAASPALGTNSLFGILANEPTPLGASFIANQAGAVTFTVEVAHINGPCPGAASTSFTAQIQ